MSILWLSLCVNDVWRPYQDFRALAVSEAYTIECIGMGADAGPEMFDTDSIARSIARRCSSVIPMRPSSVAPLKPKSFFWKATPSGDR